MFDRGFLITLQAIRRQLAAMPHEIYLIRLIHHPTRRSFPGERLWTATQLVNTATVRFLRMRNREGCDIYIQPWIHLSTSPLEPALATAAGKQLARIYGGDLASTDWRHLGRLAGFTKQKPERRTPGGYAPWVK